MESWSLRLAVVRSLGNALWDLHIERAEGVCGGEGEEGNGWSLRLAVWKWLVAGG